MSIYDKLEKYADLNLNVLFIGGHGIGKTTMARNLAEKQKLKFKYYSSSTLDPWADLVGVPVPDRKTKTIDFYRPKILDEAEFVFFDELNRAHPKVLDAILEIIQFKSVNGVPLPNLKMVWAAINPAGGDYNVEELDPALFDRFHIYLYREAEFNMEYMKTKMKLETAKVLRTWWREDMNDKQRKIITPRRLEYIGFGIDNDIEWKDMLPKAPLPSGELMRRIAMISTGGWDPTLNINKENLLERTDVFIELAKKDPVSCIKMLDVIKRFGPHDLFRARDLVEAMPADPVTNMAAGKWPELKTTLTELFAKADIDAQKDYPLMFSAFGLNEY